jgi:hypothetical protein
VLSVYERFERAAKQDVTNPDRPYTPWVPETIYVPGEQYLIHDFDEHPIYYEWNGVTLRLNVTNDFWGQVHLSPDSQDPNLPAYPMGTEVTLTATPAAGREFGGWLIYDPNHPGDANCATVDANNCITITMDGNREVTASFRCGEHPGQFIPLALVVGFMYVRFAAKRRPK